MTVQGGLDIQVPQPALLFDLDGTLVDSVYQHVIAWQEALATCGIELSVWRIHRRIGMSGGLFIDALNRETGVTLDDELSERLRALHAEAYLRRHEAVVPLPGARELLGYLYERQVPFAIATSGARHTAGSALDLLGLSVTMPHKAAVQAHLDDVRHEAAALDAVNCVLRDGERLIGANTDGAGFVDALTAASVNLVGTRVLVLGAGGAARAVIHALAAEDTAT